MIRLPHALAALLLFAGPAAPSHANAAEPAPACGDLLPGWPPTTQRTIEAIDLVRLRDIGRPDGSLAGDSPIAISPDGHRVAFQLRRADPATNSYCLAMVVMDLKPGSVPRLVDRGGDMIRLSYDLWGTADWQSGTPLVITPRWSPDGRSIAFLKRVGPTVQVWQAFADGSGSEPLTRAPDDVLAFAWANDGAIIYATRPGLGAAQRAITEEGLSGFHFDDRFQPLARSRPMPKLPIARVAFVQSTDGGTVRPATAEEAALVGASNMPAGDRTALFSAQRNGNTAVVGKREPERYISPTILGTTLPDGRHPTCSEGPCASIVALWWPAGSRDPIFLARTGWGHSALGLYRWRTDSNTPHRILQTDDLLIGCQTAGQSLICLREGSSLPRRLIEIALATGRSRTLFDPNPEFVGFRLGNVQRLHWRNDHGLECFGDLVLPPGHRPGERHPMIVVQYQSKGFLRGGTGDEYPIQLFAAHGYAVLSVERPPEIGGLGAAKDGTEYERANLAGWADRKSVLSALLEGVKTAIAGGAVDARHIGLTGLSDGVTTVQHALIAAPIFGAAAISQCCDDPMVQSNYVGSDFADFQHAVGYPQLGEDRPDFWAQHSIARNARRITAPILIQVSDDEYRTALEAVAALREAGKPVDMFVYPDERHIKWQPAHRLAVYRRNLAWFDFWLREIRDDAADQMVDARRWRSLAQPWAEQP